ncbi:plasmid pRiA4b ORF-3 family protein, partial [Streptomyces sp. NPDC054841]
DLCRGVKVALSGSRPPIWRRLQVPSSTDLRRLHDLIQAAFGWEDYHMWVFETGGQRYGVTDRELGIRSATAVRLDQIAPGVGARFGYTYDFGDNWEHDILVEAVGDAEPGVSYPRCLTGRRAGRQSPRSSRGRTVSRPGRATPSTLGVNRGGEQTTSASSARSLSVVAGVK